MITVNDEPHKVGLALSGGGFRASIFHTGVLKRLSELGMLPMIDVISAVSGGSILEAYHVQQLGSGKPVSDIKEDCKKVLN